MEPQKTRKKETAQEAFKKLREKTRLEREQKLENAQERVAIANVGKKDKAKNKKTEKLTGKNPPPIEEKPMPPLQERKVQVQEPSLESLKKKGISSTILHPKPPSLTTHKSEHHASHIDGTKTEAVQTHSSNRKRRGRCTNCCGGLPGEGPGFGRVGCGGQCCCDSGNRLRGGGDHSIGVMQAKSEENRSSSMPSGESELSRTSRRVREACGYPMSQELADRSYRDGCGSHSTPDSFLVRERSRGGCGGCGGSPQPGGGGMQRYRGDQYQQFRLKSTNYRSCSMSQPPPCCRPCPPLPACQRQQDPCCKTSSSCANTKGCCPCGGCGGAACSDEPGNAKIDGGCCGGSRPRGLPCKCKCQSCSDYHPRGGCGGQSCGKIYSCAGSGGGRCCFPRNYKRRSGPDCCGGADPNCGGCC